MGVTGASGIVYTRRLLNLLLDAGIDVHLVVSPSGRRVAHDELGIEVVDAPALLGRSLPASCSGSLSVYSYHNTGAVIASGSFIHDGMIIIPCSSNTLSAVASGRSENLLHRAAHVCLKQRRRLVLVHREMPISLIDIRNMQVCTEAGAVIAPASPGFYQLPERIEDLVDFVAGRCLDLLSVPHSLSIRWSGGPDGVTRS